MSFHILAGVPSAILICVLAGCGRLPEGVLSGGAAIPPLVAAIRADRPDSSQFVPSCPESLHYDQELAEARKKYSDEHPDVIRLRRTIQQLCSYSASGRWQRGDDGARVCHGLLTRNMNDEYCSADMPKDWRPFSFDGQSYFFQPLKTAEQD